MKKFILLFVVFAVCYSCSEDSAEVENSQLITHQTLKQDIDETETQSRPLTCDYTKEITVASLDDLYPYESVIIKHLTQNPILEGVNNIRDIIYNYNEANDKEYIEAIGDNNDDGLTTIRVEVHKVSIEAGFRVSLTMSFDTCSGVNCSKCSFKNDGSCKCDKIGSVQGGASYCNHSTSC